MAKRKLKVIPIYKFFQIMDLPTKVIFMTLFLVLAALSVGLVMSAEDPLKWSMEVVEVPATQQKEVTLTEYTANYRTMTADVQAYKENVIIGPRMISPKDWMALLFAAAMALGWTTLLTGASYIKGYGIYGAFLLYGIFAMVERLFEVLAPGSGLLIAFGLVAAATLPAFLINQGYIKMKLWLRFLVFLILVGGPYFVLFYLKGWTGLHRASAEAFQIYLFFSLAFLFVIASEINNMVFYLATNAKKRKYRVRSNILLGVFIVIIGIQFMMLQDALGWDLVEIPSDFPFRPLHLVAVSALFLPWTKQNLYPAVKNYINNRGMSFALMGFGILGSGIVLYHSMLGEMLYSYSIERLAIIIIFLTSLFHLLYTYYNFGTLLRARVNFYFISMMPRKLMYFFVVIATFLIGFGLEASSGFHSRVSFSTAFYNRLADAYLVEGDKAQAMGYYNAAVGVAEGTAKGNYNRAILAWTVAENPLLAEEHFQQATQFLHFPPAYLNLAALELESGVPSQAKFYLKKGLAKAKDPYLHNNLAQIYVMFDDPDSAIIHTKEALKLDPDNSTFYGNLATIYMDYERYDEAAKFFKEGLKCDPVSPMTVTNAFYLDLAYGANLDVGPEVVERPEVRDHLEAWFNLAISRFRRQDFQETRSILDSLTSTIDRSLPDTLKGGYRPPELLFLDGCLKFEEGEVTSAITRMEFLDQNFPNFRPYTKHFLAAAYHGQGVPGMAAEYYRKSIANGVTSDLFNEALMEIDRGNHDNAFNLMMLVRAQDSTYAMEVAKEEAMLQMARGEYLMAALVFDASSLTRDEWTRIGLYAGKIGNIPAALEAFRNLTVKDPQSIVPYLEMGRVSLANDDTLAMENLAPGLNLEPDNSELLTETTRAYFKRGFLEEGRITAEQALKGGATTPDLQFLEAEVALVNKDTAKAIVLLDTLHKRYPLKEKITIQLSRLLRSTEKEIAAQNLVVDALELNTRSPELELELARVERDLGRIGEAAQAAQRAMAKEISLERMTKIQAEFAKEIELLEAGVDDFFGVYDDFAEEDLEDGFEEEEFPEE